MATNDEATPSTESQGPAASHPTTGPLHRACLRLATFLLAHARGVLTALGLSVVVSLALIWQLKFDFTPQAIYRGGDDLVEYSEKFKQTFGYDEAAVLVVLEAAGPADVLEAPALGWQAQASRALRETPVVERVESLATVEIPRPTLNGLTLYPLIEGVTVDEEAAGRVRGFLSIKSLVRQRLLSDDDRVAAIAAFIDPYARDIDSMRRAVQAIRAAIERLPVPEGFQVHFTGLPVLRVNVVNELRSDLWRLMPLAGIVYLVVLAGMFRRVSDAFLPLVAVGVGVAWTLAALTASGESLNVVSNVLPVLLVIVGVSSSVQIVSCYADEWQGGRRGRLAAAREAIARMTPACLLAALTTAIGFISLSTARSLVLQRFGWQAAVGVACQYLSTLVTLGTLFRYFAPPNVAVNASRRPSLLLQGAIAGGTSVARHPWLALSAGAGVVLCAVLAGGRVEVNSSAILETFPEDDPTVKAIRLVEDKLSGIMPLEVSLQTDRPDEFFEPAAFHAIFQLERDLLAVPGVLAVDSYADLLREIVSRWPGRRPSESDPELVPEGTAGRVRLERAARFAEEWADVMHYRTYLSADGRRARIRVRLREIGSRQTLELIGRLEDRLAQTFPAAGPFEARLTGEAYVNAKALNTLIRDLRLSLLTASLVIFGLIALEFRSLRVGLIAAIPNLTPLAVTLGYMGLRGYDMNVGNVIVFTISLGLADDNTIHFLYRFREELQVDGDVQGAIRRAFLTTGRAILATSLLLLAGLTVLLFSHFIPTRRFGELTQVTVLGNLLGVLLLLPACLVLFWKPGRALVQFEQPVAGEQGVGLPQRHGQRLH
ncbi:MAG: efflux RND transporter permease subunit [Planctomycetaceae bacterium]